MRVAKVALVLVLFSSVVIVACDSEESSANSKGPVVDAGPDVPSSDAGGDAVRTLSFEARVGSEKFSCSRPATTMGTTSVTVEPLDFRVYVHDVRVVREDGSEAPFTLVQDGKWQYQGVALLDFEDKSGTCSNGTTETNTVLRGMVPDGVYTGVKFRIGVPFSLNHADVATAPSPLNLSGLFWSWNGGYKFARIDGRVAPLDAGGGMGTMDDAGDGGMTMPSDTFFLHLGSTECTDDGDGGVASCGRPNVGEVALTDFDPFQRVIVADYKALVADTDLETNAGGAPGCMSEADDPECASILPHLGVNASTGQPDASGQALFRVE